MFAKMPKVSLIYNYFLKLDDKKQSYQCKTCDKCVASSSTSNLRQHLKTHKDVFVEFERADSSKRAPNQQQISFPKRARITVSLIHIHRRAVH